MAVNQTLIDGIQWGGWHWVTPGQAHPTITYYFGKSGDSSIDSTWTSVEKAAYRAAINSWAEVANINVREVASASQATFIEHSVAGSFFNPPPGTITLGRHETPQTGAPAEGWYNYQGFGWDYNNANGGLHEGGFGFLTLVHEIGHGLGMAHPHDNGGGSPIWPGVTGPFDAGPNNYSQDVYTVMSYVHGLTSKPVSGAANADNYGYINGPMAYDIYAIQELYGARASHTGNNVYRMPGQNQVGTFFDCIWDTGGNDAIAYGGNKACVINLNPAALDGSAHGGGDLSVVNGVFGGFTIAHGVWIERAYGGKGNDVITGNGIANKLYGGSGNDRLYGKGGNDHISGGNNADRIWGDNGADHLYGQSGNDLLRGGNHNDYIDGGTGKDTILGQAGNDRLIGGSEDDLIRGGSGNDRMFGGSGNDRMFGDTGADQIDGQTGNDLLFGNANSDLFLFSGAFGNDRIADFEANNNNEKISLAGVSQITNGADLFNNHIAQAGLNVLITAGANSILLLNTNLSDLQPIDFLL